MGPKLRLANGSHESSDGSSQNGRRASATAVSVRHIHIGDVLDDAGQSLGSGRQALQAGRACDEHLRSRVFRDTRRRAPSCQRDSQVRDESGQWMGRTRDYSGRICPQPNIPRYAAERNRAAYSGHGVCRTDLEPELLNQWLPQKHACDPASVVLSLCCGECEQTSGDGEMPRIQAIRQPTSSVRQIGTAVRTG